MAELLFEIMCEEIPARMQVKAGRDLGRMVSDALKKAGLSVEGLETYTGPRRLALVANVPARSPDVSEERKGPRTSAPEQALAGFMRGAGISDISEAEIRSDKKGDYYVAMLEKKGRAASDIIAEILPEIMAKFPWPKSMKSGETSFRWVRPLQSLLCLLDGDVVPFEVNGFVAGNQTSGHRRMGKGPFTVKKFKDYQGTLADKGKVIIDACKRKEIILKDAKAACSKAGLELVEDEGLLSEVAGLAEWPTVILGDMDESFLKLPAEVIRLSMRTHQKYFAVRDPKTGNLAPKFIVVANQVAPDGGVEIAKGNSRVLSARLDDARFFQAEDVRDGKKLIDNYDKLDGVIFHQKLGTIKDKSERVAALARELAPKVGADPDKAEQAARLAKCDLVTNMVVEFTSLQGQIGRLMYENEHPATPSERSAPTSPAGAREEKEGNSSTAKAGEVAGAQRRSEGAFSANDHADIAIAIEEHYKPQGPSDKVPTNPVAVAVALADKLDTLVGFWAIDEKPTGSKDPFALRRAALGVVRIILENKLLAIDVFGAVPNVLFIALYFGFYDKEFYQNNFYHEMGRRVDVADVTDIYSGPSWKDYPYCLYLDGDLLVTKNKDKIGSAQINFEGMGPPYDDSELLMMKEADKLYGILRVRLDGLDGYVREIENARMFSGVDDGDYQIAKYDVDKHLLVTQASNNVINSLKPFILDRLKGHLRDQGVHHTHIDAVFALGGDDLVDIESRVNALGSFLSTDAGTNLLAGYKRAANILKAEGKKGDLPTSAPNKGSVPAEAALFAAIQKATPLVEAALAGEDYSGAMRALAGLRGPIDGFFDEVIVNSDDEDKRENRLGLLIQIRTLAKTIADFDKIEGA